MVPQHGTYLASCIVRTCKFDKIDQSILRIKKWGSKHPFSLERRPVTTPQGDFNCDCVKTLIGV